MPFSLRDVVALLTEQQEAGTYLRPLPPGMYCGTWAGTYLALSRSHSLSLPSLSTVCTTNHCLFRRNHTVTALRPSPTPAFGDEDTGGSSKLLSRNLSWLGHTQPAGPVAGTAGLPGTALAALPLRFHPPRSPRREYLQSTVSAAVAGDLEHMLPCYHCQQPFPRRLGYCGRRGAALAVLAVRASACRPTRAVDEIRNLMLPAHQSLGCYCWHKNKACEKLDNVAISMMRRRQGSPVPRNKSRSTMLKITPASADNNNWRNASSKDKVPSTLAM